MTTPTFAVSPDKTKGDKAIVENFTQLPPPPGYWNFNIIITDPHDSCSAYGNCSLAFIIQAATRNCEGVLATPHYTQPITWGTLTYPIYVPDSIPCVDVSVINLGGTCAPFTSTVYCKCQADQSTPCKFNICH